MLDLLHRYIRGDASDEEKQRIMLWLDENPEHEKEYQAARKLYDISLWNLPEEKPHRQIPSWTREMLRIAAVILFTILGTGYYFSSQQKDAVWQTIRVPAGQRAEVTLADGSVVWLNSLSSLRFPEHFGDDKRKVELEGEAYFDVEPNRELPFFVTTKCYEVKVLGTEFNVRAYSRDSVFETALVEGSVEVNNREHTKQICLQPSEKLIAKAGKMEKQRMTDMNALRWKEGLLCFEQESIRSLIEKLEMYYDVDIQIEHLNIADYRYSGKFRIKDGVEHVLKVLQLKHRFSYTIDEENNRITIK